jgi:glutamate racemase
MSRARIGVFDSGVGGLSVLREIRALLPGEGLIYFADQAHLPYGPRSLEEVRAFSEGIARFLLKQGSKIIVVACNTASAAALIHLRATFPQVPFVGMEPAVKPAAERSRKRTIGVIATQATFQGDLFASVVDRHAQGVHVLTQTCPGLVEEIERGNVDGEDVRRLLEERLAPLREAGVDALVLGCTHYPFALRAIQDAAGPGVEVIDPAPAVARQVRRVLSERELLDPSPGPAETVYITSGNPKAFDEALQALLGIRAMSLAARWKGPTLALL